MLLRQSLILILWCFLGTTCITKSLPARSNVKEQNITGTFHKGFFDIGATLTLNKDGTFTDEETFWSDLIIPNEPIGLTKSVFGKYAADSKGLRLYPEKISRKQIFEDSIRTIDSLAYYKSDTTSIKTSYHIIEWANNVYLLSEEGGLEPYRYNDIVEFASWYNSGSEPKFSGYYYCRKTNESKRERIQRSHIPPRYREYFLDSMMTVTVKEIVKQQIQDTTINVFVLNKGISSGVKEGMEFHGKQGCCILKVISASTNESKGCIFLCPFHQDACLVGDTLTSWNERDHGKYKAD